MIITGGPGDETLTGTSGDDSIDGGGGADRMIGLAGNDFYYVDNAGDQVIEAAGGGSDNVYARVSYTLAAGQEVEVLRAYGSARLTLTGNELANTLIGGAHNDMLIGGDGDDTLYGGAGSDIMDGGDGNDTYYVDSVRDEVIEAAGGGSDNVHASVNYTLGAGQEIEVLRVYGSTGLTLTGNELANTLVGGAGNDRLNGGDGNDTLYGGLGADTMAGGSGNDIYYVDNSTDRVNEAAGGGSDLVFASVSHILASSQEVEILRVYGSVGLHLGGNEFANTLIGATSGAFNDSLTGGAGNDTLYGFGGDDRLSGGPGNDTLYGGDGKDMLVGDAGLDKSFGGAGDDTYIIDLTGKNTQVIERFNEGHDTVYTIVGFTLADNVEDMRLDSAATVGTGNGQDNHLWSDQKNDDTLSGLGGNDLLEGGAGNDQLDGGTGDDRLNGEHGNDTLLGGDGNDRLEGGAGYDTLTGGAGDDLLVGGAHRDVLSGGLGADLFVFDDGDFGGVTASAADRILDFSAAEGDRFDLSAVDANTGTAADDAFGFIGTTGFSGAAGELRWFQQSGDTFFAGDVNGDSTADFTVRVIGLHTLSAGNFVL